MVGGEVRAFFVGTGSNGKSVVFDVIKSVIGKDRVSYLSPDQLDEREAGGVGHRQEVELRSRYPQGAAFDSALKALSSGQDIQGWKAVCRKHGGQVSPFGVCA